MPNLTTLDWFFTAFIWLTTMMLTNLALQWLVAKWKDRKEKKIYTLYVNGDNEGEFPLEYIRRVYERFPYKHSKYMTHNPKSATAVILIDHIKGEE